MAKVTVWTKDYWPYCTKAKALLDSLNVQYEEVDISKSPERIAEVQEKSGYMTVPQIFVDDKYLGGCDDIYALHEKGELEPILNA